jgi:hypothetical protein
MAEREYCPGCGLGLPARSSQSFCPACLLRQGMASEAMPVHRCLSNTSTSTPHPSHFLGRDAAPP